MLFYFCHTYLLITKQNVHLCIKPVGIAADKDLCLRSCRVWNENSSALQIHIHQSSYPSSHPQKRKNQLFFNTSVPFSAKRSIVFIVNKTGMKVLQLLYKIHFLFSRFLCTISTLSPCGTTTSSLSPCLCFKSFIGEGWLKNEVFSFFQQEQFYFRGFRLLFPVQGFVKVYFMFPKGQQKLVEGFAHSSAGTLIFPDGRNFSTRCIVSLFFHSQACWLYRKNRTQGLSLYHSDRIPFRRRLSCNEYRTDPTCFLQ